ncbi:DUF5977 domain-containing protein, partial [Candidatus Symbiothrix dinenymphae]|uniref:DUF5977 domain-containing protein n=1 Tax=Candidatus Symbiothrix dinenymphae TaxID=467085 RepID=UPI000B18B455
ISNSTIKNLGVTGTITAAYFTEDELRYIGAIVGEAQGRSIIENCYNIANIVSPDATSIYCSGIAWLRGNGSEINNCYNAGDIGGDDVFGIASGFSVQTSISNSFAANATMSARSNGSFRIRDNSIRSINCYANQDMTINGVKPTNEIGTAQQNGADAALDSFKSRTWFAANLSTWNFTNVWDMPNDDNGTTKGLPVLRKTYCNNTPLHASFTKNDCLPGYTPSPPEDYAVPVGTIKSNVSTADANTRALELLNVEGQKNANDICSCIELFRSVEKRGTFTRNNCDPEYIGSQVTYIVAAGNHTSTISQADADSKADADVADNGQAYANTYGSCTLPPGTYVNVEKRGDFTRNNCIAGYIGSTVWR